MAPREVDRPDRALKPFIDSSLSGAKNNDREPGAEKGEVERPGPCGDVPGEKPLMRAGLPADGEERGGEPMGPKLPGDPCWEFPIRRGAEGELVGSGDVVPWLRGDSFV